MDGTKKPKGRPAILTPEKREQNRIADDKKRNEIHKKTGYASQKKYRQGHYRPPVILPGESEDIIKATAAKQGKSINALFISAFEKQYGVTLMSEVDRNDN